MPVSTDFACAWKLVSSAAPLQGVPSWKTRLGRSVTVQLVYEEFGTTDSARYGAQSAVGGHDGQRVEHGAGVHDADLVEAGLGGVEALLLGVDPEDQRAALLGCRLRDAVASRAVGRRACDPVPAQAQADAPAKPAAAAAPPASSVRRSNFEAIGPPFPEPTGPPEGSRATLVPRTPGVGAVPLIGVPPDWDIPGFAAWLGGRSAATRKAYVSDVGAFAEWMSRSGVEEPGAVDRLHLRRYLASLGTQEAGPRHDRPQGGGAALLLLLAGAAGSPRLRPGPVPARPLGRRSPPPRAVGGRDDLPPRRAGADGRGPPRPRGARAPLRGRAARLGAVRARPG